MMHSRQPIKTYDVHPISIKLINRGHPWITKDKFSEKFHPNERFIVAANRSRPFALLLHDPNHKFVRARVWSTHGNFQKQMKSFKAELAKRIQQALLKRKQQNYLDSRNHFYLIFGEGDQIPGVLVQYLNGEILVQFYMDFWNQYKDFFLQNLLKSVQTYFNEDVTSMNVWLQERTAQKKNAICQDPNISFRNVEIEEFGVKYKVCLGKYYDHGIYTDMAQVRSRLIDQKLLDNQESVLNLFSYTGAYSLLAMKLNAKEVHSVDLSEKYLEWLDENIKLNTELNADTHHAHAVSTIDALKEFEKQNKKFSFIISDPPSSSSDGKKKTNALSDYSKTLPLMDKVISEDGKILVFLNTHKCTSRKFRERITQIIKDKKLKLKISHKYYLAGDCPSTEKFPEGCYLKGLLLERND